MFANPGERGLWGDRWIGRPTGATRRRFGWLSLRQYLRRREKATGCHRFDGLLKRQDQTTSSNISTCWCSLMFIDVDVSGISPGIDVDVQWWKNIPSAWMIWVWNYKLWRAMHIVCDHVFIGGMWFGIMRCLLFKGISWYWPGTVDFKLLLLLTTTCHCVCVMIYLNLFEFYLEST